MLVETLQHSSNSYDQYSNVSPKSLVATTYVDALYENAMNPSHIKRNIVDTHLVTLVISSLRSPLLYSYSVSHLNFDDIRSCFHSLASSLNVSFCWLPKPRSVESALFETEAPPPFHISTTQHTSREPISKTTWLTWEEKTTIQH